MCVTCVVLYVCFIYDIFIEIYIYIHIYSPSRCSNMKDDIDLRMVAIIIDGGLLDIVGLPAADFATDCRIAGLDCWIAGLPGLPGLLNIRIRIALDQICRLLIF